MLYLTKGRFWLFIIIAFILGAMTRCTVSTDTKTNHYVAPQAELYIPESKQKEAAELYAKVYTEGIKHTVWAEAEARKAVITVYGVPKQNP